MCILSLYLTTHFISIRKTCQMVLERQMGLSLAFEHRPAEVTCWLQALQNVVEGEVGHDKGTDKAYVVQRVIKVLDRVWDQLHLSPYRAYDALAEVRQHVQARMYQVKDDRFQILIRQIHAEGHDDEAGEKSDVSLPFSPLLLLLSDQGDKEDQNEADALGESIVHHVVTQLSRHLSPQDTYILHGVLVNRSPSHTYLSPLLDSSYLEQFPSSSFSSPSSSASVIRDYLHLLAHDSTGTKENQVPVITSLIHALLGHRPLHQAVEVGEALRSWLDEGDAPITLHGLSCSSPPHSMRKALTLLLNGPSTHAAFASCFQTLLHPQFKEGSWIEEEILSLLLRCIYSLGPDLNDTWYSQYLIETIQVQLSRSKMKGLSSKQVTWISQAVRAILTHNDSLDLCRIWSREEKGWSGIPCPLLRALASVIRPNHPEEIQPGMDEDRGVLAESLLGSALPWISRVPGLEDLCFSLLRSFTFQDEHLELSSSTRDSLFASIRSPAASVDASVVRGRWRLVAEMMCCTGKGMKELHRGVVGLIISKIWPPSSWTERWMRSGCQALFIGLLRAPQEVLEEKKTRTALIRLHEHLCPQRFIELHEEDPAGTQGTMMTQAILQASRLSKDIFLTEIHAWKKREEASLWIGSARQLSEWTLAQGLLRITLEGEEEDKTIQSDFFSVVSKAILDHLGKEGPNDREDEISILLQEILVERALVDPLAVINLFSTALNGKGDERGIQITARALLAFLTQSHKDEQRWHQILFQALMDHFSPNRVAQMSSKGSRRTLVLLLSLLLIQQPHHLLSQCSPGQFIGIWHLLLQHYQGTFGSADQLIFGAIEASEQTRIVAPQLGIPSPLPTLLLWGCQMLPEFSGMTSLTDTMMSETSDFPVVEERMMKAALDRLDPRIALKTLRDFPDDAGLPFIPSKLTLLTDTLLQPMEEKEDKRVDPSFWLSYAMSLLSLSTRSSPLLLRGWVERNGLGLTLASLGSPNGRLRQIAYSLLDQVYPTLNATTIRFRGASQVALLLTWIKDAITTRESPTHEEVEGRDEGRVDEDMDWEAYPRLPGPIVTFAAQAVGILLNPEHHLFPSVNRHLLQRPVADLQVRKSPDEQTHFLYSLYPTLTLTHPLIHFLRIFLYFMSFSTQPLLMPSVGGFGYSMHLSQVFEIARYWWLTFKVMVAWWDDPTH